MTEPPTADAPSPAPASASAGAVILAAGRGSRMGRSKPLLPWGDRTLLEAWVARFREAGVQHVVAVVGADAEVVRAQLEGLDVTWAVNPEPDSSGLRESLLLGLDALPPDTRPWFTPVDVPVVTLDTLRRVGGAYARALRAAPSGPGPLAAVPSYRRRSGHPVLAGPSLVAHLYEGERGDRVDAVLTWATRRQVVVEVDDVGVVGNMNRPEDYRAFAPPAGSPWDWTDALPDGGDELAQTLDLGHTNPAVAIPEELRTKE